MPDELARGRVKLRVLSPGPLRELGNSVLHFDRALALLGVSTQQTPATLNHPL